MELVVTAVARYHYFRIFNSWNDAFDVQYDAKLGAFSVTSTGQPFNDAYRYVDWLLTVPLLLIELILVMQLPSGEASSKMWTLGLASALMVAMGYPGEIQDDPAGRWFFWACSMVPFLYVVYELVVGLAEATARQAPSVASITSSARYLTAVSWLTYPFVSGALKRGGPHQLGSSARAHKHREGVRHIRYVIKSVGLDGSVGQLDQWCGLGGRGDTCSRAQARERGGRYMIKGVGLEGATATAAEQVGYSIADVVAKAIFGILVWRIAHEKTLLMEEQGLLTGK